MASRHQSREMAFQLVYEWSLNDGAFYDEQRINDYWTERSNASALEGENYSFYRRVLRGVANFLPQIDSKLEQFLENWAMKRVDRVDLAVLRLAVFELLFDTDSDRPDDAVIINEAIEMAKKYGGKESPSFVNGVLDKLSKSHMNRI